MSIFTPEEKEILKKYVTDTDGDVFCVTNMQGLAGAVYARYSRAKGGFREVMLKEFIKEGLVDVERAAGLIERVLIAYGDDSVGELEGAHLSVENVSILATKEIEDRRIGGSPIEQSTRYVFYDQLDEAGKFRYYREPRIMASDYANDYETTLDFVFQTYCDLIEPMKTYYQGLKPIAEAEYDILGAGSKQKLSDLTEEQDKKAFTITYNSDIRTKACDSLRSLLPLATKTNVGLFGNGRYFQNVLSHLMTSDLIETQQLAMNARGQLDKVIPHYVKRASFSDYQRQVRQQMWVLAQKMLSGQSAAASDQTYLYDQGVNFLAERLQSGVTAGQIQEALAYEQDSLTNALMLYEYCDLPLQQLLEIVRKMSDDERTSLRQTYIGVRRTRRDKPYRALEAGYMYTFDLVTDFGTYKDLERHRMTSQLRQRFSPRLGFIVPDDIKTAGYEEKLLECHRRVSELYEKLVQDFPLEASYVTLHGHKVRWVLAFNEREAYHLLELRTTPQGHPQYRAASQLMHKKIEAVRTWRAEAMKFVDHNEYFWSRADSEAKQRVKERKFEENNK